MPYYRKRNMYRRRRPARRYVKRRGYRRTAPPKRQLLHRFVRSYTSLILLNGSEGTNFVFNLGALEDYSDFTNLYEFYRINAVKIKFLPTVNSTFADTGLAADPSYAMLLSGYVHSVVDRIGTNTVSLTEMVQQADYKCTQAVKGHSRYFKPNVLVQAYESSTSTGYIPKYKQWISTDDPTVPHYGLDVYYEVPDTTENVERFRVVVKLYIECKGIK